MKPTNVILDDPVVQDVRAARAKLWQAGGSTVEGFLRVVKEVASQKQTAKRPSRGKKTKRRKQPC